jgi:hypothetical protein
MREKRNACRLLVGNAEGERALEKSSSRWVDDISMDLRVTGWLGTG